jgi:hypothetical protein
MNSIHLQLRHPREGGEPAFFRTALHEVKSWAAAFAGVTYLNFKPNRFYLD